VDNYSKILIRQIGGFYVCNEGISFGIKLNSLFLNFLYILLITLLFYKIIFEFRKNKKKSFILAIILIGGLSNILEKLIYSCITDFIPFFFLKNLYFNISDIYISTGVIVLYLFYKFK
jgi:signal peptidase II